MKTKYLLAILLLSSVNSFAETKVLNENFHELKYKISTKMTKNENGKEKVIFFSYQYMAPGENRQPIIFGKDSKQQFKVFSKLSSDNILNISFDKKELIDSKKISGGKISISNINYFEFKDQFKVEKERTKNTYSFKDKGKNYTLTISTEMLKDDGTTIENEDK